MLTTTDTDLTCIDTSHVTGIRRSDTFLAVRLRQGGRTVYALQLLLSDVPRILPVPDPTRPTPGNRKVDVKHAAEFGRYVREHADWVAPPLLVRDGGRCTFTPQLELPGDIVVGLLEVPHGAVVKIVDGQHRVLGVDIVLRGLSVEEDQLTEALARGHNDDDTERQLREHLADLDDVRGRFGREHLGVYVYEEQSPDAYEQMFFDVADNALGIRQAVKVSLRQQEAHQSLVRPVAKHRLLAGRVDVEQDRITGANPNLVGAKHVIDMVRSVNVGVMGRITKKREAELDEETSVENTMAFLDALVDRLPVLADVAEGDVSPAELHATSLAGSLTMLRVLAGVFHNLALAPEDEDERWTADEVAEYFASLSDHMAAPVAVSSIWICASDFPETPDFTRGAYGPQARSQNIKHLTEVITKWAREGLPS